MGFDDEEKALRHCNVYGCKGIMRPTKFLDENRMPYTMRMFQCEVCNNCNMWLAYPERDGSYGEVHKLKGGEGCSGASMLSDPRMYPPERSKLRGRRTK